MAAVTVTTHRAPRKTTDPGFDVFAATGARSLGGWNDQAARTALRPRERLINLFRAPQNLEYLRALFTRQVPPGRMRDFVLNTLEDSVYAFEKGEDLIYSDPIAQRGDARAAASLWAELRRINRAYYENRMQLLRDQSALITGVTTDGQWDDNESYHYRMFTADSLHPPGMEHLNGTGPLYAIREEQVVAAAPGSTLPAALRRPGGERENFSSAAYNRELGRRGGSDPRTSTNPAPLPEDPGVDPDDWGWDNGRPNRTAEQAVAEYWGEDRVESSTLGATETGGESYLDRYGQGTHWRENGGTRFQRYPTIPIWQNLSRGRDYDRDIDETLGTGNREMDNQIRRWDMDRVRQPRGEEYRRYGPRSGSTH